MGCRLQKAAAVDPDNQASVPGEAGAAARQARLDACYAPVAAVIRFLVRPPCGTVQHAVKASHAWYRSILTFYGFMLSSTTGVHVEEACEAPITYNCLGGGPCS